MKTFDQLTPDQQMDAFDQMRHILALNLIKGDVILSLRPYEDDIMTVIDHSLKGKGNVLRASPFDFLQNMEDNPQLKLAFLHEVGRMIKKAAYP